MLLANFSSGFIQETSNDSLILFKFIKGFYTFKIESKVNLLYQEALYASSLAEVKNHYPNWQLSVRAVEQLKTLAELGSNT